MVNGIGHHGQPAQLLVVKEQEPEQQTHVWGPSMPGCLVMETDPKQNIVKVNYCFETDVNASTDYFCICS